MLGYSAYLLFLLVQFMCGRLFETSRINQLPGNGVETMKYYIASFLTTHARLTGDLDETVVKNHSM
jgi:hypothetical protein